MDMRDAVRNFYGEVAEGAKSGCCAPGCCGAAAPSAVAVQIGYTAEQLAAIPDAANLGLGCGNPTAIAALQPNETVVDLGSGAGIDCFLAAAKVGPGGHVIGVDMTPSMLSRAREAAARSGASNVEFRLGEIEHLPVADNSVDVIISNCVVNLSPDKREVFREAFRVLKPGGRLAISDIVATAPIPVELAEDVAALAGCVGNAELVDRVQVMLIDAGFEDVIIDLKEESAAFINEWIAGAGDFVISANIAARKPE